MQHDEEDEGPFQQMQQQRQQQLGAEDDEDDEDAEDRARRRERGRRRYEAEVVVEGEGEGGHEEDVERKPVVVDRRLARLEEARRVAQEGRQGGRRRHEAEVIAGPEEEEESEGERPEEEEVCGWMDCCGCGCLLALCQYIGAHIHTYGKKSKQMQDEFVSGDVTLPKREEEGEEDDEEAIARRRAAIRERLKRLQMGACVWLLCA